MGLLEDSAKRNPHLVEKRGRGIFIDASAAGDLINESESSGVGILGIESFVIGDATYPALSRIADFSMDDNNRRPDFVAWSCRAPGYPRQLETRIKSILTQLVAT
jgi:hypothetical protein